MLKALFMGTSMVVMRDGQTLPTKIYPVGAGD